MQISCAFVLCVFLGVVSAAPSVFQRNGLQREQESVSVREPFEPQSPFQLPQGNIPPHANNIVVPPTISLDATYIKPEYQGPVRNLQNHFETLNKDALVGLLIENHIPFYVKTVVDPLKPVQTKIHVMRIPKKFESTSPLPNLDLNMVEVVSMNASGEDANQEVFKTDDVKQVETLEKAKQKIKDLNDGIVKVTESRPEDGGDQPSEVFTLSTNIKKNEDIAELQNDDPNAAPVPSTTPVYERAIIYTPEKKPDTKSFWDHLEVGFERAKARTGEFVDKAKDKTGQLYEKAKEKAKDIINSNESKSTKEPEAANPADDI